MTTTKKTPETTSSAKTTAKKSSSATRKKKEENEKQVVTTPKVDLKKKNLKTALKYYFGFDNFKGDQESIIKNLLAGNDTFVLMPTGGGKSLCYQLPALLMEGTAIVISPLIALMKNQVDAIKNYADKDNIAHFINSSLTKSAIDEVKRDVLEGRTKLLYVAPESLNKTENIDFLHNVHISFYAIDEAHCISEWGHDFRPEYRNIRPTINKIGNAPVIALTATATDKVRTDIKKNLGIQKATEYKSSFNRPNLYYEVRAKTANVDKDVIRYIKENAGKSGIIYCLSRKKVEELAQILKANEIKAAPYHAGLDQQVRTQTQDDFIMERIDVIVATIAFGMGIDKPDVRFVIHYDIPKSLEGYYQETGRAGRDGEEGRCIAFFSQKDLAKLQKFTADKGVAEQEIGRQLLRETANYCLSSVCRRKLLLHYFGEEYEPDNCGNCDNCLHPKKREDCQKLAQLVFSTVQHVKENFKQDYIIDLLRGNETETVLAHHHEKLNTFGEATDASVSLLNAVINQAQLSGLLRKDIDNYGLLKLTEEGKRFIKHPEPFFVAEDNEFDDEGYVPETSQGGSDGLDPQLYAMLETLRRDIARKNNLPPYVIFQDNSLQAMATLYPITPTELGQIPGAGVGKARRYGGQFLELIQKYCKENEIERPTDMTFHTVPKKSKIKADIVNAIDRQVALDDIAELHGLDFEELLDIIDSIVYAGTRINIGYFIEDVLDDDVVDEIYDYFRHSDTDDVDTALEHLDDDIDDIDVRLVRIKFLSEQGN